MASPTTDAAGRAKGADRASGMGRTIKTATIWSTAGRFVTLVTGIASQFLLVRVLAKDGYGHYVLLYSVSGTIAFFASGALPQTAVRSVTAATLRLEGPKPTVRRVLLTGSGAAALAALVSVALLQFAKRFVLPGVEMRGIIVIFAVLVAVRVFENVVPEVFRGLKDFRTAAVLGGALAGALLVAGLGTLIALDTRGLDTVVVVTALATALPMAVAALRLRGALDRLETRKVRRARREAAAAGTTKVVPPRRLLSPYLWLGTAVSYVITQMDLWVVARVDEEHLPLYAGAFRLSMFVMVPAAIVNFVVPPLVVQLLATKEHRRLQRVLGTVAAFGAVPSGAIVLLFVVAGPIICRLLLEPGFSKAGPLLAILAAGKLANVATGACGITLVMSHGERENLVVMVIDLVVTLGLQVAMGLQWGVTGVAVATAIGIALQNALLVYAVRRRVGIWTFANPLLLWEEATARLSKRRVRRLRQRSAS